MDNEADCKKIETFIKGMIFPNLISGPSLVQSEIKNTMNHNSILDGSHGFASNIEKASTDVFKKSDELPHQTGMSELIDVTVLTNFAARHIEDSGLGVSKLCEVKPPHPDLEEDCPKNGERDTGITNLLNTITKEIENSSHFLCMPENPLLVQTKQCNPKDKQAIEENASQKKRKKVQKEKKTRERMAGLYVQREQEDTIPKDQKLAFHKEEIKSIKKRPVEEAAEPLPLIKLKKDAFSAVYKEYSIALQEGQYRFQCVLCSYNSDSKDGVVKHLNSKPHRTLKLQNDQDMLLPFLPPPLPEQKESISELLLKIISVDGLTQKTRDVRNNLSQKLKQFVLENLSHCSVELIGSSATGCGLENSEVDLILKVPSDESIPDFLENIYELIKKEDDKFEEVLDEFKQKRPCIKFKDKETSLPCNILIDSGSSLKLANTLTTYFQLDERALQLGIAVRYWARICQIDQQACGTLPSICFPLFVVHFLQQVQPPVLPVLNEVKGYENKPEFYEKFLKENDWKSQNSDSLGDLWLKFFHYYNFEYTLGESVVCIRSSKQTTCKERNWSTKFYAVEDPFMKRNLAYVIPTFQVCNYIAQCFLRTYRYFAYPQLATGSIQLLKTDAFDALNLTECISNKPTLNDEESGDSDQSDNEDLKHIEALHDLEDHDPDLPVDQFVSIINKLSLDPAHKSSDSNATQEKKDGKVKQMVPSAQPICYWDVKGLNITKELFMYEFRPVTFKGNKPVTLTCKLCKGTGHQKKDCPVDDLPKPQPLPKMTQDFLNIVTKALYNIKDTHIVNESELNHVEANMHIIQTYIREVFPDAKLTLFGSFCNGFGFRNKSDMDFCLTFGDRNDGKDLDNTKVIQKVARELHRHPELENIVPITSAKVPIVKFSWVSSGVEGDISLYNTLALVNTELLQAYSKIDSRVQVLGYAFKHFAKVLGICDASRGSLSSYAYILMVVYFLQQRDPPVVPVLQELYDGEKPVRSIDDWNVWFYGDISKLEKVWPDFGKNKESIGELWLGLLNFYTCDFNWKEYVVSIRQKKPLTRFRKLWITNQLAIEDPFDLKHDLGAGLSRKMNSYILKTFIRARERFGIPVTLDKIKAGHEVAYLFNRNFLNSGLEPPQDRGCGNCGKIGHIAKNCPQEKICSYCRQPGHLIKNCPKKGGGRNKRTREKDLKQSFDNPKYERRGSDQYYKPRGNVHPKTSNDLHRTYPNMQPQPPMASAHDSHAALLQMGVPTHRMPHMGFPPPGFQALPKYTPPFGVRPQPPHPSSFQKDGQSPPKHFHQQKPSFYQQRSSDNKGRTGLQVERHPVPKVLEGPPGFQGLPGTRNFQPNPPQNTRNDMLHSWRNRAPPSQRDNTRQQRTHFDNTLYNSNHSDRF